MNALIKKIRETIGISQEAFAGILNVSFSTVNEWENDKAYPNRIIQMKIYELAKKNLIDVSTFIYEKIQKEASSIQISEGRLLLYHGSKSGIKGKLAPISRIRCDFGKGFYMGTIPEQPLTLICGFEESRFYIVSLDLDKLESIFIKPDLDWAMFVAFHRGKMENINGIWLYKKYEIFAKNKDVIIGNIANDRMFFVLDNFFEGNITDIALTESLSALKLGEQYVAITQKACDNIRIEKEIKLFYLEKKCLQDISETNRSKGVHLANDICKKYRREGAFFDEILAQNFKDR